MEIDGDFDLLPSSPVVHARKLKRLKKATAAPEYPSPPTSPTESEIPEPVEEELNLRSVPEPESLGDGNVAVEENGLGARRALEFDSVADEEVTVTEKGEEIGDLNTHESEKKRPSSDVVSENKEHKMKKKKRIDDGGDGSEKNPKEATSSKRKTEKVRVCFYEIMLIICSMIC